jgi:hypothetical protein
MLYFQLVLFGWLRFVVSLPLFCRFGFGECMLLQVFDARFKKL